MAKFVRWLGAYCSKSVSADLVGAALWEVSQADREVACEPLLKGRSLVLSEQARVHVGLIPCMDKTIFVRGYLRDAFTKTDEDGTANASLTCLRSRPWLCATMPLSGPWKSPTTSQQRWVYP